MKSNINTMESEDILIELKELSSQNTIKKVN